MKGKNRREYGKIIECLMSSDPEVNLLGIELLKKKSIYQNLPKWYRYDCVSFITKKYIGFYRLIEIRKKLSASDYDTIPKVPFKQVINSLDLYKLKYTKRIILSWLLLQLDTKYNIYWKL